MGNKETDSRSSQEARDAPTSTNSSNPNSSSSSSSRLHSSRLTDRDPTLTPEDSLHNTNANNFKDSLNFNNNLNNPNNPNQPNSARYLLLTRDTLPKLRLRLPRQ